MAAPLLLMAPLKLAQMGISAVSAVVKTGVKLCTGILRGANRLMGFGGGQESQGSDVPPKSTGSVLANCAVAFSAVGAYKAMQATSFSIQKHSTPDHRAPQKTAQKANLAEQLAQLNQGRGA